MKSCIYCGEEMTDEVYANEFTEILYFGKICVFPVGKHAHCDPSEQYLAEVMKSFQNKRM